MTPQLLIELVLAAAALGLLVHGAIRTWRDPYRRPIALFLWAVLTAILAGVVGGAPHPEPLALLLPLIILVWEVTRGWKRSPRCHIRESAFGVLALALLAYIAAMVFPGWTRYTVGGLSIATLLAIVSVILLVASRFREPRPWLLTDWTHYERRSSPRP